MATTSEQNTGAQTEACAHCGKDEQRVKIVHCRDCQFVYCADHADADDHHCQLVCRECTEVEVAA